MRTSPLMATAVVFFGLGLLAIPLTQLTAQKPVSRHPEPHSAVTPSQVRLPTLLRVRLLKPARSLNVRTEEGQILWQANNLPIGESEHDAEIEMREHGVVLQVEADFGENADDTALFLTLMPDGLREETRYSIGSNRLEETLHFRWLD